MLPYSSKESNPRAHVINIALVIESEKNMPEKDCLGKRISDIVKGGLKNLSTNKDNFTRIKGSIDDKIIIMTKIQCSYQKSTCKRSS